MLLIVVLYLAFSNPSCMTLLSFDHIYFNRKKRMKLFSISLSPFKKKTYQANYTIYSPYNAEWKKSPCYVSSIEILPLLTLCVCTTTLEAHVFCSSSRGFSFLVFSTYTFHWLKMNTFDICCNIQVSSRCIFAGGKLHHDKAFQAASLCENNLTSKICLGFLSISWVVKWPIPFKS